MVFRFEEFISTLPEQKTLTWVKCQHRLTYTSSFLDSPEVCVMYFGIDTALATLLTAARLTVVPCFVGVAGLVVGHPFDTIKVSYCST